MLFGAVAAQEYVPGTPGAPWTIEEALVVKAKLWSIFHTWGGSKALSQIHGDDHGANWQTVPDERKMLRLGFHDCLKYDDGTGGCDGCLNWEGVGKRWNLEDDPYPWPNVGLTNNNGLEHTVDVLEHIYINASFPVSTKEHLSLFLI